MKNAIVFLSGLCFLIACNQNGPDPELEQKLETKWSKFIEHWENENAEACAMIFSEDGTNIPPESSIKTGRQEIAEFYEFLFSLNQSSVYNHEILNLNVFDNNAIEQGQFQVNWTRNDSTEWTYKARSLTHWTLNDQNEWEIKALIFNPAPEEN